MKAISALLEGDKDMALAWNAFYTQMFTNLYKILREGSTKSSETM